MEYGMFAVQLSKQMKDALWAAARKQGVSPSEYARRALAAALAAGKLTQVDVRVHQQEGTK